MKKVLIISTTFWPEGGGGTLATYLITKLLSADLNITVVTGTRCPVPIDNVRFIISRTLKASNKLELLLRSVGSESNEFFRKLMRNFDIIYIPYGYPLIPLAKDLGKKVIVHVHDLQPISYFATLFYNQHGGLISQATSEFKYEIYEHASIKRGILGFFFTPITMLYRIWLSRADIVLCASNRQREIIASHAPELAGKLKVVRNPAPDIHFTGRDLETYNQTFLFLGGDSYIKGFYTFLTGSRLVLKRSLNAEFIIAGKLKEEVSISLKRISKYRVLGRVPHYDIFRLYRISRALLYPSICEETFGYPVLEAMLVGTIPIASKAGGVPEIVNGTYAERMLFKPGAADELADKIEHVFSMSKEDLIDVGYKLREDALNKFDNKLIKRELLKVFL